MRANEVLDLLKITRPTLCAYVKSGKLDVETMSNGQYDYCEISVQRMLNYKLDRKTVAYILDERKRCLVDDSIIDIQYESKSDITRLICDIVERRVSRLFYDSTISDNMEIVVELCKKYYTDFVGV